MKTNLSKQETTSENLLLTFSCVGVIPCSGGLGDQCIGEDRHIQLTVSPVHKTGLCRHGNIKQVAIHIITHFVSININTCTMVFCTAALKYING